MRKVSASYGVLVPDRGIASRTTFVVDPEGKIQHIEEGDRIMKGILEKLQDCCKIEMPPKMEGKRMVALLAPKGGNKPGAPAAKPAAAKPATPPAPKPPAAAQPPAPKA